jgi:hypothetical protein
MGILDTKGLHIVNYEQARTNLNKSFIEADHPRDKGGKFTKKGAGESGGQKDNGRQGRTGTQGTGSGAEGRRQDGQGDSGHPGLVRSLSKKAYPAASDKQYTYHHIEGGKASKVFHDAITASKEGNPFGAFVHAYEEHEYNEKKNFISEGGEAGMSVTKDGDIVSVFNNPKIGTKKGVAGHMLEIALENGGKRLDCFDGFLPKLYSKYGFVPVARMKFAREYAPEGWNFERDGEPDVLFFAHNGDDVDTVRNTNYPPPDMDKVPYITDYDDGARLQAEFEANHQGELVKSLNDIRDFMSWKTRGI